MIGNLQTCSIHNFKSGSLRIREAYGETLRTKARGPRAWRAACVWVPEYEVRRPGVPAVPEQEKGGILDLEKRIHASSDFLSHQGPQPFEWCLSTLRVCLPRSVYWLLCPCLPETPSETHPEVMLYQLPRYPLIQSSWLLKFTIKPVQETQWWRMWTLLLDKPGLSLGSSH